MSHRRAAVKQKRVRQVRRQIVLICSAMVVLVAGIVYLRLRPEETQEVAKKENTEIQSEEQNKDQVKELVEEPVEEQITEVREETEEERIIRVRAEAKKAGYPEKVIELLDKNPETVDFVEGYGAKKESISPSIIKELKKGEIPKLIQWDERWGYASYGTGIMAVCGCGPTCLSMVVAGLNEDNTLTPVKLAQYGTENDYITEENDTKWSFMTEACEEWGVKCREDVLNEKDTLKELDEGHPIVCSVGPGDFTQKGHFILLAGHEEGKITVYDPFSMKNSNRTWTFKELQSQIKVMWIYSKK